MIEYSFSPNWYRPQCLVFSFRKRIFYYTSNCIVYKYDLEKRRILSQINIKDWLIKKQGYNLGSKSLQKQQLLHVKNDDKPQVSMKGSNREKQPVERERVLKINCIELLEINGLEKDLLIVGLNYMGLVLIVSSQSNDGHMKILEVIDLHNQTGSQITGIEHIYVDISRIDKVKQSKEQNKIIDMVIFSCQGIKINAKLSISELKQLNRLSVIVDSYSRVIDINNKSKKNKYLQIKAIAKEEIIFSNLKEQIKSKLSKQHQSQHLQQKSVPVYVVFLTNIIQILIDSIPHTGNILLYDSMFNQLLYVTSIEQLLQLNPLKQDNFLSQKDNLLSKQYSNGMVLSADFLSINNGINKKYAILTKPTTFNSKPNAFCQQFYLHSFYSQYLISVLQNKQQQTIHKSTKIRTKLQIIYPKKCHHKLTQQQKSTLCIKLINQNNVVLTGRLGEMIIINLKQIQLQIQTNPSLTITIRPYSYEEEENNLWRIQHSQRHYKDIYAIYRVYHENQQHLKQQQSIKNSKLYFIGTDHILTQWKYSTNPQMEINNQNLLSYESNLKFLTSSVDQIVLSELEPSVVFLRLRDSNIRSFEPYSDRSYWLNQFWKHTNVSFCKKVQKIVMHPKDIGVACLVNDQSKLILYDLYEERLIKLIEIMKVNHKAMKKSEETSFKKDNKNHKNSNIDCKTKIDKQVEKSIQINSISFEHISIISCLQSLYSLHENEFASFCLNEQFDVRSQQFYDKVLDKETVIMIQSNEFVLVLIEGVKQQKYMRMEAYKKVFKLERIYKTKYWDGNVLIGTRKKKGQLMFNVSVQFEKQQQKYKSTSQEIMNQKLCKQSGCKSLEKEISLPLGVSSRYIFKLSEITVNDNDQKEYLLIVINYKGNKLCIAVYCLKMGEVMKKMEQRKVEDVMKKQENDGFKGFDLQLYELMVTQEMIIPSLQSHSSPITIQHLIISQQPNQYLIGIYSNATQTISIIDYTQIVNKIVQEKGLPCQKLLFNEGKQKHIGEEKCQLQSSYKRSLNGELIADNNQDEQENSENKIEVYQFSGLSYKIESMVFNSVFSDKRISDISHLIILGKDQSVRLLNLTRHIDQDNLVKEFKKMEQEKQRYTNKVHKRSISVRAKIDKNIIKQ